MRSYAADTYHRATERPITLQVDFGQCLGISGRVKSIVHRVAITTLALTFAACATGKITAAATAPLGTRFSAKGKLTLHRGEPCTSQIMFDFRPLNSRAIIWMAASAHESRKLTDAARDRRGVRISGVWRRGQHAGCAYVEVKSLTVESSWWNKLFKP
jgi:hypothetical protein